MLEINGVKIFRPSDECEEIVYRHVKSKVFEVYKEGIYTDRSTVVKIVNANFKTYYELIDAYLSKIQPLEFAAFLLNEYENYGKVEELFKAGMLSENEEKFWQKYAGHARRGIKHLLELLCIRADFKRNVDHISLSEQEEALSIVFIAVEEMVSLYMRSHLYNAFYDVIELTLDESKFVYFSVKQDSEVNFDVRNVLSEYHKYVPSSNILRDTVRQNEILGDGFIETFGADYRSIVDGLRQLIDDVDEVQGAETGECRIVPWETAVNTLSNILLIKQCQAEVIINGFSVSAAKMLDEGRELNRPKQQYRAYRRGFFVISHGSKSYLIFSRRMAMECLQILESGIAFRKLPQEWMTKPIKVALDILNNHAGRWFENIVVNHFSDIGINGRAAVKSLVLKDGKRIRIPQNVGEIDFIGISEEKDMLIVVEIKQVDFSTEPRMYMDDLDKFLTGSNNYCEKFERKVEWAIKNYVDVVQYLEEALSDSFTVKKIGYIMITHYPSFIASRITKFSCLSITEFMMRHRKGDAWNFSAAVLPLSTGTEDNY